MKKVFTIIIFLIIPLVSIFESSYSDHIGYEEYRMSDWELMKLAIIDVESKGDSLAIGTKNDVGILQITPIYLKEVNRICGYERYTLNCRRNPQKSIEMFEIYQNHHNPKKDIDKAIKLHNPKAGSWYSDRVYRKMEELKQNMT